MRAIDPGLQNHLLSGATTLCSCWLVSRADGIKMGFTDHDQNISFDGQLYEADSGFTRTDASSSIGFSVDNMEVHAALSSDKITEKDLAAGVYDNAKIEIFLVNWQDPDQHLLLKTGSVGEVRRGDNHFMAEIRGLSHFLQQPQGRLIQARCDADLGDGKCQINLDQAVFKGTGNVASVPHQLSIVVSGLDGFASGWFTGGVLTWQTGENANRSVQIKTHMVTGNGEVQLDLWQQMAGIVAETDTFSVTAGCDKSFTTCKVKFSNGLNFRGCPHVPGNDFVLVYPNRDDGNQDGGSLNG